MNQEIKQCWVKALRSGEYQQTTGGLRSGRGFCCLGVLTDLYLKEHDEDWMPGDMYKGDVLTYHILGEYNYLPPYVQKWAFLHSASPSIIMQDDEEDFLANLNDDGYTFEQIADLIENQL